MVFILFVCPCIVCNEATKCLLYERGVTVSDCMTSSPCLCLYEICTDIDLIQALQIYNLRILK